MPSLHPHIFGYDGYFCRFKKDCGIKVVIITKNVPFETSVPSASLDFAPVGAIHAGAWALWRNAALFWLHPSAERAERGAVLFKIHK